MFSTKFQDFPNVEVPELPLQSSLCKGYGLCVPSEKALSEEISNGKIPNVECRGGLLKFQNELYPVSINVNNKDSQSKV